MLLSTEQTRVVMHGLDNRLVWSELDRPTGPQMIPAWCKGANVDWVEGYSNSPRVRLKVIGDMREWPDKRFRKEGRYYRAYHPDGRVEQYAHDGAIGTQDIRMFKSEDGTLRQYRREGPEYGKINPSIGKAWHDGEWVKHGYEPGDWVDVPMRATTAQGGFGGSYIHLRMEDGSTLVLRGPWHVGAPPGYAEVSYVDVSKPPDPWASRKNKPWYERGGRGGLYLRHDVFVNIMARFAPHLPLANVTYGGATTIEPFKAEWGEPKRLVYEREWLARKAARDAQKGVAA